MSIRHKIWSRLFCKKESGDIYQNVRYAIGFNLSFVASSKPATGPAYDVIKMAARFDIVWAFYIIGNSFKLDLNRHMISLGDSFQLY